MGMLAIISLTSSMGHRFYNQPALTIDIQAPETIIAPFDASVPDPKTTEEKRKAAQRDFIPVLTIDRDLNAKIWKNLDQSLTQGNELRSQAGEFPFTEESNLSLSSQIYLRDCPETEWEQIKTLTPLSTNNLNGAFDLAFKQIRTYRQQNSAAEFANLVETIILARRNYAQARAKLADYLAVNQSSHYESSLFELSDEAWQETRKGIQQAAQRMLAQGIPAGLPTPLLEDAIKLQVLSLVPPPAQPLAVEILLDVLKPNLIEDREETKKRAEQAAKAIATEIVTIKKGEVIILYGQKISHRDFILLDYFGLSRRGFNWLGLLGFGSLVSAVVGLFLVVENRVNQTGRGANPSLRHRDNLLVLLLVMSTPLLASTGTPYTNLPAIGVLVSSFYGSGLATMTLGMLVGLDTIGMGAGWEYWLVGAAGGIVSALMAGKMRSREELAVLGVAVGLTQTVAYLVGSLIFGGATTMAWYSILQEAAFYGLAGLSWTVVAIGLSPYLENLFDLITPVRLAELSNPNCPLLKELAAKTPGTFQHTLFVATLAEAAAKALGCNVELVRAGTLYHDIGKMHDPLGFIENQMGKVNKHDEINNPWVSAEIIKKHVSEGLVMARKHRLPKAIQAFIPEHQGTILIAYFYHQAQQLGEQAPQPLREEDFRYVGPIPQSRETGIVMLADGCEAALRSLKDATAEEALTMINKLLRSRWQEKQLVDSGLTREDLKIIADVFVKVWQQSNHQRIVYPNREQGIKGNRELKGTGNRE